MIRLNPVFLGILSTSPLDRTVRCARLRRASLYAGRRTIALAFLGLCAAPLAFAGEALAGATIDRARPAVPGSEATERRVAGDVTVAVASSLRALWPRLETRWRETLPGVEARPTFGASRTLARQIARGAPFELLLAADEESIERLPPDAVDGAGVASYAIGRLALVLRGEPDGRERGRPGDGLAPLERFVARLASEPALRLAIPNPAHAPYGRAAREALAGAGAWPLETGRLVVGENAAQTLQFVLAGAVDGALVPWSLVVDGAPPGTRATRLPADAHAPLLHRLASMPDASPAARALRAWFLGEAARAVFAAGGFDAVPDDGRAR